MATYFSCQVNDFKCVCPDGYEGKDCGHDIDDCLSNPCFNGQFVTLLIYNYSLLHFFFFLGSTCVDGVAEYKCVCLNGMTGRNCEIDIGLSYLESISILTS